MYNSLEEHIQVIIKELQCKLHEIAIISFDNMLLSKEGVDKLKKIINIGVQGVQTR